MPQNILTVQQGEKDPFKLTSAIRELVQRLGTMLATASTDKALARYSGTTGSLQDSAVIVDDLGNISSFGGQIKFPATQNPSADANTLDDYEEGAWMPVLDFATHGDLSISYVLQSGYYTKAGRMVCTSFTLSTSAFTWSTAAGSPKITGLPFVSVNDAAYRAISMLVWQGITKANYTQYVCSLVGNASLLIVVGSGSGQPAVQPAAADFPSGGTVVLTGNVTYIIS